SSQMGSRATRGPGALRRRGCSPPARTPTWHRQLAAHHRRPHTAYTATRERLVASAHLYLPVAPALASDNADAVTQTQKGRDLARRDPFLYSYVRRGRLTPASPTASNSKCTFSECRPPSPLIPQPSRLC